jgi:hypothetical protein
MVILKNGIKSVTHRFFFSGRTLKKRDIWNKFRTPGHFIKKRDCPGKNGTNGNPKLLATQQRTTNQHTNIKTNTIKITVIWDRDSV